MKGSILLNHSENTKKVEEQEQLRFVRYILESMNLPLEDIYISDEELSIENKIKLKNILYSYNIEIINYADGNLEIYLDKDLIGKWEKPIYTLKKDLSAIDPKKKLYLEMQLKYWSVFDDTS